MRHLHSESHLITRIGWLRAAVLGVNDGIISTASLMMGVATAAASSHDALVAGIAGLAAGAKAGGADVIKPMIRVTFWGALAMAMTTGIGTAFGKIL